MMTSRREFLGGAAAMLLSHKSIANSWLTASYANSVVLFQGDSVTDNYHDKKITLANDQRALGAGYPYLVAAAELRSHPEGLSFFNRGISGNKIPDLEARWQTDTLDLKPNVLSVLIGVNDFWHTMLNGYAGTLADYETRYGALLERTRSALPGIRLVVIEPVALRGKFVDDRWYPAFAAYQAAARRVARAAHATFVPLQRAFDEAARHGGPQAWLFDGVHPTPAGHALIAERWRHAVKL
jgi:lysophospholipase L1-like esterase